MSKGPAPHCVRPGIGGEGDLEKRMLRSGYDHHRRPATMRDQILVKDGGVDLWGCITSEAARSAVCVVAENIPGVKEVRDHLTCVRPDGGAVTSVSVDSAKNIVQ